MVYSTANNSEKIIRTKSLIVLAVIMISLFVLTSCSSGKNATSDSSASGALVPPKPTYTLTLDVKCAENLLFSTYDVDIYIDDEKCFTLDHGSQESFSLTLESGPHTFVARKEGSSSVEGSASFDMPKESAVLSCELSCYSEKVRIDSFELKSQAQVEAEEEQARQEAAAAEEEARRAAEEAEAQRKDLEANGIQVPDSASNYRQAYYYDAESSLRNAGFTNITVIVLYELSSPDGGMFSGYPDEVSRIAIANNTQFEQGDYFYRDAPVVIEYKAWEYDDPSLSYKYYSVSQLLSDLESNAMRAKETHKGELVQVDGYIDSIDSAGDIYLTASNSGWDFEYVICYVVNDEHKQILMNYSKGDYICFQGRIMAVSDILGYSMDIYHIL